MKRRADCRGRRWPPGLVEPLGSENVCEAHAAPLAPNRRNNAALRQKPNRINFLNWERGRGELIPRSVSMRHRRRLLKELFERCFKTPRRHPLPPDPSSLQQDKGAASPSPTLEKQVGGHFARCATSPRVRGLGGPPGSTKSELPFTSCHSETLLQPALPLRQPCLNHFGRRVRPPTAKKICSDLFATSTNAENASPLFETFTRRKKERSGRESSHPSEFE